MQDDKKRYMKIIVICRREILPETGMADYYRQPNSSREVASGGREIVSRL